MSYSRKIIQKFGGINPMARILDIPPSTVQGWKERGVIPARRQVEVIEAARREGIAVSPADFFDMPDEHDGAEIREAS